MTINLFHIRPYTQLPMPMPILPFEMSLQLSLMVMFTLLALLLGYLLDKHTKKIWELPSVLNMVAPVIGSALLFLRYGFSLTSLKGLIFLLILLYAANSDIKKREVTDWVAVSIVITALIGTELRDLPCMIIGSVFIAVPQIVVAVWTAQNENKEIRYGGADIKIMTACTFLLGLERGPFAAILGLTLAVLVTLLSKKIKKQSIKVSFPVVPYLALASFTAFLI